MVPLRRSILEFSLLTGLLIGCGPDSKPNTTTTDVATAGSVDANFEAYLKDGTVFIVNVPVYTFKMTVDRTTGSAQSKEEKREFRTRTSTVSFVKDIPDGKLFKIKTETSIPSPADPQGESYTLIANDGLYPASSEGKKLSPIPEVPAKLEVGKEWKGGQSPRVKTGKAVEKDSIEVPAGKFEAYKIALTSDGHPYVAEFWFAPGKGIVKDMRGDVKELKQLTVGK